MAQILPEHYYPHQVVQINDNSAVTKAIAPQSVLVNPTKMLFVFASPKGIDGKLQTLRCGYQEFLNTYGIGAMSSYGQPLLNAYAAACTGVATLHCLRVTQPDASYSNVTVMAKYKYRDGDTSQLDIKFFAAKLSEEILDPTDLAYYAEQNLLSMVDDNGMDEEGFTVKNLFTISYKGKGAYGKNVSFKIVSNTLADKYNHCKNNDLVIYTTEDGATSEQERFTFCTNIRSVVDGKSNYMEDVVMDVDKGSKLINLVTYSDSFDAIVWAWKKYHKDSSLGQSSFDIFTGIDKYNTKSAIDGYYIIPEADATGGTSSCWAITPSLTAVSLQGGSDGSATVGSDEYFEIMNAEYLKAYNGSIDPQIVSENRYPTNFIMDANFPVNVKEAIATLANKRGDCVAMIDCGTDLYNKTGVMTYVEHYLANVVGQRLQFIEPYAMTVRDPYSFKSINVTSTYWLCSAYPKHISNNNGKHVPLAGNSFGVITGHVTNSVYPIFEAELDSETMDDLAEAHINFAKYNPSQLCVRAMQDSSQDYTSSLSEQNNVLVLLDIKREVKLLCASYEYNFSDVNDIGKFNQALALITERYAAAQVKSITAQFSMNEWEAQRNILHLNVSMQFKSLVRDTIIEIDIEPTTV